jgi:hypothetical protein
LTVIPAKRRVRRAEPGTSVPRVCRITPAITWGDIADERYLRLRRRDRPKACNVRSRRDLRLGRS